MEPILYLVIPCYNEEEVLPTTSKVLKEKMDNLIKTKLISKKSKILFIDDGSKDNTWNIIEELNNNDKLFRGVKLSRNKGHQNALLAGLITANEYADITISMDADLQDDVSVIDMMVSSYKNGNEVVYGVRSSRKKDSFFKRTTAEGFYKIMKLFGVDIVFNHADCRLLSKRAIEALKQFKEVNLFLRGIVPLIGFNSDIVYYERNERFAGVSKYPLKKMLAFAGDGITSFSIKPLRMILAIGVLVMVISIGIMIYALVRWMQGAVVEGWTFLAISIWFIGGLQMISLGVIGEYVGKVYNESKHRPRYIIDKIL